MKHVVVLLFASFALRAVAFAQSDPVIVSVQQALKEQGFYYGEVSGRKDADTSAAIRRYQIRNGLQVTGELNAETQKALGVKGNIAPLAQPSPPRAAPSPIIRATPPPQAYATPSTQRVPAPPVSPQVNGLFAGTPYQTAPLDSQRRVIAGAQTLLARRGYYRDVIDGEFGPGTDFALRAFQSRFGIAPTGRLDMDTLAAMGLLPGQRAPGVTAPVRRGFRRPSAVSVAPDGEPIYEPR